MSWQTADLLSADTTDVLAAVTTDVLAADTTSVMSADTTDVLSADTTDVSSADPAGELSGPLGAQGWPSGGLRGKCCLSTVKISIFENTDRLACTRRV